MLDGLDPAQQIRFQTKLYQEKIKNPVVPTRPAAVSIMLFLLHAARSLGNKNWVALELVSNQSGVPSDMVKAECVDLKDYGLVFFNANDGVRLSEEGLYIARKLKDWLDLIEQGREISPSSKEEGKKPGFSSKIFSGWSFYLYFLATVAIFKLFAQILRG